jgi:hypothetical protein
MIDSTESHVVFLFVRDPAASQRLHAPLRGVFPDDRIYDRTILGMRNACATIRAGESSPCVLVIEQEVRDSASRRRLALTRALPELASACVVVLGDATDGEAERLAREDGADGFLAIPPDDSEPSGIGERLLKFVSVLEFARVR